MKKKKVAVVKKKSTPIANQSVTDVKITEDTTCIVNFTLAGAFSRRQSNSGTKEEIWKMKRSPYIEENKKGRFLCAYPGAKGRKLEPNEPYPANYYTSSAEYKPCFYHKCYQRKLYSSEVLRYLISDEARPFGFTKQQWDNLNTKSRLEAQFSIEASSLNSINPSFTFDFVN